VCSFCAKLGVGTIAACECDVDIVGDNDALVVGIDLDRGTSIEN
jgi:hypothetical protein